MPTGADPAFALTGASLRVRDPERVAAFYQAALELERLPGDGADIVLASDGAPLLTLIHAPDAPPRPRRSAGLFHLAFLLESRSRLAASLRRIAEAEIHLSGASDHGVSEALYLDDPEGNGVEIYVDRPREAWPRDAAGGLAMVTERLDIQGVLAAGAAGGPVGPVRLGHVHLEVGDENAAAAFYRDALPFEEMQRYPSAAFLGADGYHHHLGLNCWRAKGAGPMVPGALGLAEIRYQGAPAREISDPWGIVWRHAA